MNLPPCCRCDSHEPKDLGEYSSQDDEKFSLMLVEVQLTTGIVAWLCCNCRTEWLAINNVNTIRIQQNRLRFKLEYLCDMTCRNYVDHLKANRESDVEELAVFWDEIMALEPEIDRFARVFLSNRPGGL